MSKKSVTFIDLYLDGLALAEDISDSVSAWHGGLGAEPIYDYLGMTEEEYSYWLRDPDVLPYIAIAHKENRKIAEVIQSAANEMPMAARSSDAVKVRELRQRLKRLGKID